MTLFLRNEKNRTVVDIEISGTDDKMDVRVATIIPEYSKLLLDNIERKDEVIEDFRHIDELRGWFWEVYMEHSESPSINDVTKEIKAKLFIAAKKYNLNFVID